MADHFDVFMLTLGPLGANCFILACDGRALVIDPGDEADVVAAAFDEIGALPQAILVTHGHFDHIGGVEALARRFELPVYVGAADAEQLADPQGGPFAGFAVEPVSVEPILLEDERRLDLVVPVTAIQGACDSRHASSISEITGILFSIALRMASAVLTARKV